MNIVLENQIAETPFYLQGMLFHWTVSENLPVFSYWVCGRLTNSMAESKESYVAYHESASQQMVELAYRLAFGVHT